MTRCTQTNADHCTQHLSLCLFLPCATTDQCCPPMLRNSSYTVFLNTASFTPSAFSLFCLQQEMAPHPHLRTASNSPGTLIIQQLEERRLHIRVGETDPILFVVQPGPILRVQLLVRGERLREDHLGQIATADRTVILPAQHPNPGRTLETAQMVALADGVVQDLLEADHTNRFVILR